MSAIKISFVELDGEEKVIENAKPGTTLMELAKAHGVDGILADCGGGCACATCHVYVDAEWQDVLGAPDEIEEMTLDMVAEITKPNSRLSCQVIVSDKMNGLKVSVAPCDF